MATHIYVRTTKRLTVISIITRLARNSNYDMSFLNFPSSQFPETRMLDATFPTVLREEETWRRAHDQLGQCLRQADLGGECGHVITLGKIYYS